jgi:hypothetical protein
MIGPMLVLAVALLAGLVVGVDTAAGRPCSYHGATQPHIVLVNNSVVTLEGSGSIGGCPRATRIGTARVRLSVCLQHLGPSGWVDVACKGPVTKGWSRYYRFARQLGLTVSATCVPGLWRTIARGGDGLPPVRWTSAAVKFTSSDQYACGEPGGA